MKEYLGRMPTDFARCESKHCPKKMECLRFTSPPWENDAHQVYVFILEPKTCDIFVSNEAKK
jgi:hypothetical protein